MLIQVSAEWETGRVDRGEAPRLGDLRAAPYDGAHFIDVSAKALRDALLRIGAAV